MTINSNPITNEESDLQAAELIKEIEKANQEMGEYNSQFEAKMDSIEEKTAKLSEKSKKTFSEIDQLEKETGDELDKLMMEQSEVLADDSDEDENIEDEDDKELE